MKSAQLALKGTDVQDQNLAPLKAIEPNLIFVFGGLGFFKGSKAKMLNAQFPGAHIIGCSTAGEISNDGVSDNSLVITAMKSTRAELRAAREVVKDTGDSWSGGHRLGLKLADPNLTAVFLLGPGMDINGVNLIAGIQNAVGERVLVTGGLAGDGGSFAETYTYLDGEAGERNVVAIGFYGRGLTLTHGSAGGWKPFGPVRTITRSKDNVVLEIDGAPALEVYKKYLGKYADQLPAAGLLYPFEILQRAEDQLGVVRTIFGIDEKAGALVFGGNVPEGSLVRLMFAKNDALVEGAMHAAELAQAGASAQKGLGLLVSCLGRRLVFGANAEDEIDAVSEILGVNNHLAGFYSNGEISPLGTGPARLHNQTMTITWLTEDGSAD